jgi:hypothetical protein
MRPSYAAGSRGVRIAAVEKSFTAKDTKDAKEEKASPRRTRRTPRNQELESEPPKLAKVTPWGSLDLIIISFASLAALAVELFFSFVPLAALAVRLFSSDF